MMRFGMLGLAVLLTSAGAARAGDGEMQLAWQMNTIERGYAEDFGEGSPQGAERDPRFGSGVQSNPYDRLDPYSRGQGPYYDDPLRRPPNLGGKQGGPYFRPGTGRNCTGQGAGRTCF